jgi:YVTN family beta-propeller protein
MVRLPARCPCPPRTTRWRLVASGAAALSVLVTPGIPVAVAGPSPDEPHVLGTIALPAGAHPLAVAVSQANGRIYVTDDATGTLLVLDPATHAVLSSVTVGGSALRIALDDSTGKVFVASDTESGTPGLTPGTGRISVVDMSTNQLVATVNPYDPAQPPTNTSYRLVADEARDIVLVTFRNPTGGSVGFLDAATNAFSTIPGAPDGVASQPALDDTSGEFVVPYQALNVLAFVSPMGGEVYDVAPTGGSGPVAVEVNENGRKVYAALTDVPGQPEAGLLVLNRDTGVTAFAGKEDLGPLVFDPTTDVLYAGARLAGTTAALLDGTSNQVTGLALGQGGVGAAALRASTGNVYLANQLSTFVVNGKAQRVARLPTNATTGPNPVVSSVAVRQSTGRVYVLNDDDAATLTVLQDGPFGLGRLRVTTSPPLPGQVLLDGTPADTWGLTWAKVPPGTYALGFTHVDGWTEPAPQTITIADGQVTTAAGNYVQRGWLRVQTSPAVAAAVSVDGTPRDNFGLWTDLPVGSHQVCFGTVAGFDPPSCQSATLTAGNLTNVTATYVANPSAPGPADVGQLRVTTSPAVPAQILVDGVARDTWGLNWLDLAPGTYSVAFAHVQGYTEPPPQTVTIAAGRTTTVTGQFQVRTSFRVRTSPPVPATISIDGTPRDDWGFWSDLPQGRHEVCFGPVPGLRPPPCRTVTLSGADPQEETGIYVGA